MTSEISENIEKLKTLTKKLNGAPTLNGLVDHYEIDKAIYEKDKFWGVKLLFVPNEVAVQRTFMKKGLKVLPHKHIELEVGIVLSGTFKLNYKGETSLVKTGEVVIIESNQKHSGTILEDTEMVFVSMPPAKGYPK